MSAVTKVDRWAGLLSTATTALATLAVLWLIGVTVVHVVLRATGTAASRESWSRAPW